MYALRQFSIRNSRFLEILYNIFDPLVHLFHPLWRVIGYQRVERPAAAIEAWVKGALFDCQMCGRCILSSTGMSCPMNCPKSIRNGPCGGVRANGNCEVKPEMACVWVEAWSGSRQMKGGDKIANIQKPVDYTAKGTSAWMRIVREENTPVETREPGK